MKKLLEEILEIPEKAELGYQKNKGLKLPLKVPYLGMGSSYNAPLTLFYSGAEINPQIASEYYYYLAKDKKDQGVLISQSGESSETVWCLEKFHQVIAITNHSSSTLAKAKNTLTHYHINAGEEEVMSSTKTYTNTLITLYLGLGFNPLTAIKELTRNFSAYQKEAQEIAKKIYNYIQTQTVKGFYVTGSGPNIGTAFQSALTLSETTKLPWIGMPVAQYDHGPKETANDTVVLILNSNGKDLTRIKSLKQILETKSSALIVELSENNLPEPLCPLTLIPKVNFLMYYLAQELKIKDTFSLGSKVTLTSR